MSTLQWIYQRAPGFADLAANEREAIIEFTLVWSFFEAEMLNNSATTRSITELTQNLIDEHPIDIRLFQRQLDYFKDRYLIDGQQTVHFDNLRLPENDLKDMVISVLKEENTELRDILATALIIIFRFRNNLFHGHKWDYDIRKQLDNFKNACDFLMTVMDYYGEVH